MSRPSSFGYYTVPSLGEVVFDFTGARWWLWLALFALASLVAMVTGNPYPMAVAVAVLAFAILGSWTA